MRRRQFLAIMAGVAGGCLGAGGGRTVVNELVIRSSQFNFDAASGDRITVNVENVEGYSTFVSLLDPDDNYVFDIEVRTETTEVRDAEKTGVYAVLIQTSGRARIRVGVAD